MSWKNWPYWLRGGVLSAVIYFVLAFIVSILAIESLSFTFILAILDPLYFPLLFLAPPGFFGSFQSLQYYVLILITGTISYFIIGALIGFIIGKIKSKESKN